MRVGHGRRRVSARVDLIIWRRLVRAIGRVAGLPVPDSPRHRPSVPGDGRRANGPRGQRDVLMCTLEGSVRVDGDESGNM